MHVVDNVSNTDTSSRVSELNTNMAKVYGMMFLGMMLSGFAAYFTANSELFGIIHQTALKWVLVFSPLIVVLVMSLGYERLSATSLFALFLCGTILIGMSLSTIVVIYTAASIAVTFFITGGLFGAMSFYGYFTKKDLSSWGQLLFWGLIGIIVALVANIFIGSTMLTTLISCVGVILFLGLTAYDTQTTREILWRTNEPAKAIIFASLSLYLDVLNLFIFLLNLLGVKKD